MVGDSRAGDPLEIKRRGSRSDPPPADGKSPGALGFRSSAASGGERENRNSLSGSGLRRSLPDLEAVREVKAGREGGSPAPSTVLCHTRWISPRTVVRIVPALSVVTGSSLRGVLVLPSRRTRTPARSGVRDPSAGFDRHLLAPSPWRPSRPTSRRCPAGELGHLELPFSPRRASVILADLDACRRQTRRILDLRPTPREGKNERIVKIERLHGRP